MNISFNVLLQASEENIISPFHFKRKLLQYKKDGILFFTKDIAEITYFDYFSIYFCFFPSHYTEINAFPVPTKLLQHHKSESSQYLYLKPFFEYYYDKDFDKDLFLTYDYYHPYVGNMYSWYYKKTK